MKYIYTYFEKKIIVFPKMKKVKNGIMVYYSRKDDERKMSDYTVATADTPNGHEVDWEFDAEILGVNIKRPILWGLLGYRWEVAERLNLLNIKK